MGGRMDGDGDLSFGWTSDGPLRPNLQKGNIETKEEEEQSDSHLLLPPPPATSSSFLCSGLWFSPNVKKLLLEQPIK